MNAKNVPKGVVSNFCTVKNISQNKLLAWYRDKISPQIRNIKELGTGVDFCLGMEILFPGCIGLHKIKYNNPGMSDRRQNFKHFQTALNAMGVTKDIPIEKLESESYLENYYFARWFKCFFEANYTGQVYDLKILRPWNQMKIASENKSETKRIGCGDCLLRNNPSLRNSSWKPPNLKQNIPVRLRINSNIMASVRRKSTNDNSSQTENNHYESIDEHLVFVKSIIDELSEVNRNMDQTNNFLEESKAELQLEKDTLLQSNNKLETDCENYRSNIMELKEKLEILEKENVRVNELNNNVYQSNEKIHQQNCELQENISKLKQCNEGLTQGLMELKRCNIALENTNQHILECNTVLERDNKKFKKKEREFESTMKSLIRRNLELERDHKMLKQRFDEIDAKDNEFQKHIDQLEQYNKNLIAEAQEQNAKNDSLVKQQKQLISENKTLLETCEFLTKNLESANEYNDSIEMQGHNYQQEVFELEEEVKRLKRTLSQNVLKEHDKQLNNLVYENNELKEELKRAKNFKTQFEVLEGEMKNLNKTNADLEKLNKYLKECNGSLGEKVKQSNQFNKELTQEINESSQTILSLKQKLECLSETAELSKFEKDEMIKRIRILEPQILDIAQRCIGLSEKIKYLTEYNAILQEKLIDAVRENYEQEGQNIILLRNKASLESKITELLHYNVILEENKQDLMKSNAELQLINRNLLFQNEKMEQKNNGAPIQFENSSSNVALFTVKINVDDNDEDPILRFKVQEPNS